jgi:hypothetical protein
VKCLVLLIALVAACGDDHQKMPADAGPGGDAAPMPDAPPMPEATLTSYVIDLVQNHTNETEAPRAYSEFSSLPDPDRNNGSAYAPLFP